MNKSYGYLSEIVRAGVWMMHPTLFNDYQGIIINALANPEIETKWFEKRTPGKLLVYSRGHEGPSERLLQTTDVFLKDSWEGFMKEDQVVNVLPITGPVTRGGAPCAFGTRDLADRFLFADNHENVIGHLVILDTPGGDAMANDLDVVFQNAKKPVVGLIRGMNCSKGVWISSFIPSVFAEREDVEIGCIGAMWNIRGVRDGIDRNNVVSYQIYDDKAEFKNEEVREAIQNDNLEPAKKTLSLIAADFRSMVKKRWPNVPDEKLTGKVYRASEVIGEMVDGIKNYEDCVKMIFDQAGITRNTKGIITPQGEVGEENPNDDDDLIPGNPPEDKKKRPGCEVDPLTKKTTQPVTGTEEPEQTSDNMNPQMIIPMNKEFLEAIPGMGAVAVDDKGLVMLTEEQSNVLQSHLANGQAALSLVETQKTTITGLQQQMQEKDLSIKELSEATGKGIVQPVPTNDNGVEKVSTMVDGPIVSGKLANYKSDMNALKSVLSENGFIIK